MRWESRLYCLWHRFHRILILNWQHVAEQIWHILGVFPFWPWSFYLRNVKPPQPNYSERHIPCFCLFYRKVTDIAWWEYSHEVGDEQQHVGYGEGRLLVSPPSDGVGQGSQDQVAHRPEQQPDDDDEHPPWRSNQLHRWMESKIDNWNCNFVVEFLSWVVSSETTKHIATLFQWGRHPRMDTSSFNRSNPQLQGLKLLQNPIQPS